tara:strand:- start:521 stop:640 length:120 start_codon:yes stop_codon:yes gene_type:complete
VIAVVIKLVGNAIRAIPASIRIDAKAIPNWERSHTGLSN